MKLTPISFNLARVATRGLGRGGTDAGAGAGVEDAAVLGEGATLAGSLWDEATEGRERGASGGGEATSLSSLASNRFTCWSETVKFKPKSSNTSHLTQNVVVKLCHLLLVFSHFRLLSSQLLIHGHTLTKHWTGPTGHVGWPSCIA